MTILELMSYRTRVTTSRASTLISGKQHFSSADWVGKKDRSFWHICSHAGWVYMSVPVQLDSLHRRHAWLKRRNSKGPWHSVYLGKTTKVMPKHIHENWKLHMLTQAQIFLYLMQLYICNQGQVKNNIYGLGSFDLKVLQTELSLAFLFSLFSFKFS